MGLKKLWHIIIGTLFSLIVFTWFFLNNFIFWTAYIFAATAIMAQVIIQKIMTPYKGKKHNNTFFRKLILCVGYVYLAMQLSLSAGMMSANVHTNFSLWIAVLPSFLLTGSVATIIIILYSLCDDVKRNAIKEAAVQPDTYPTRKDDAYKNIPKPGDAIKFNSYNWRVLDVQEGKVLILSDMALTISNEIMEKQKYNETYTAGITWEKSSIRSYLNMDFYESFSDTEKLRILETGVKTPENTWYGTSGGEDTIDKVFLLSIDEVVQYFGNSGKLQTVHLKTECCIDDQFNKNRKALDGMGSECWWWLRSPGRNNTDAAYVNEEGQLYLFGRNVDIRNGGIRPAMWIRA